MASTLKIRKSTNPSSIVDLDHVKTGTICPGALVPVTFVDIVAGDSVLFSPKCYVKTMPALAPLMGRFDICLEYFFAPDRLYNYDMYNNTRACSDPSKLAFRTFPQPKMMANPMDFEVTLSNYLNSDQLVCPSSLAEYLGFPVGYLALYRESDSRDDIPDFNLNRIYTYIDVFRNYYANPQEDNAVFAIPVNDRVAFSPYTIPLDTLDDIIYRSRSPKPEDAVDPIGEIGRIYTRSHSFFCRSYVPERLDVWLNKAGYESGPQQVSVSVENNEVRLTDARFGGHVLQYMELSLMAPRYDDWLGAQFNLSVGRDHTIPVYLGSSRGSLIMEDIYQTSETTSESALGSVAGKGESTFSGSKRRFTFDENGTFMVVLSLRPRVNYSRGIDPMLFKTTLEDKYAPELDRIGFQPLFEYELDAGMIWNKESQAGEEWPYDYFADRIVDGDENNDIFKRAVGYQPAWSEYTSIPDRTHGLFATSLAYWTLTRSYTDAVYPYDADYANRYDPDNSMWNKTVRARYGWYADFMQYGNMSYSSYILPWRFNGIFADQDEYAENFMYLCSFEMKVRRQKSKMNMPAFV